jgi:hypothetical protein
MRKQRAQVEQLKKKYAFLYRVRWAPRSFHSLTCHLQKTGKGGAAKSGFLQNQAIQDIVNAIWFRSSKADAIAFEPLFNPFPKVALALVFTAVSSPFSLRIHLMTHS